MLFRTKRCFAAGLASVFAAAALMTPASAALTDQNGDGVVNVFDFVLSKRALIREAAPANFSVTDAEAAPGECAAVYVDLTGLSGYAGIDLTLHYDAALLPAAPDDGGCIRVFAESAADSACEAELHEDTYSIHFSAEQARPSGESALFSVFFRIPEEAENGTVYALSLSGVQLLNADKEPLAFITEFGKIKVTAPDATGTTVSPPVSTTKPSETTETSETTASAVTDTETSAAPTETTTTAATTETTVTTTTTTTTTTTETTTSETTTTTTYMRRGIDISQYQGNVDFKKVAADPNGQFAILRAGYGKYLKQEDSRFRTYYDDAKAAGIPVGAYWYSYAKTPEDARIEANVCLQVLGDRVFEYPIALDIETEYQATKLTKAQASAIIDAFCSEVQKKGYYVTVYSFASFLNHQVTDEIFRKFDVWVAHVYVSKPSFARDYGAWQYSWKGAVNGISVNVDLDYCYRDYPAIMKKKHLNGY